jgi:hypothetical protein
MSSLASAPPSSVKVGASAQLITGCGRYLSSYWHGIPSAAGQMTLLSARCSPLGSLGGFLSEGGAAIASGDDDRCGRGGEAAPLSSARAGTVVR